ncbi:unnamed protein product, partial [Mesorhabditis spiculigera]
MMILEEKLVHNWTFHAERVPPEDHIFWAWNILAIMTLPVQWLSMGLIRKATPESIFRPYAGMLFNMQIYFMVTDFCMNAIRPVLTNDVISPAGRLAKLLLPIGAGSATPIFTGLVANFLCAATVCFLYLAASSHYRIEAGPKVTIFVVLYHILIGVPIWISSYFLEPATTYSILTIFFISQIILWTVSALVSANKRIKLTLPILFLIIAYFGTFWRPNFFNAFAFLCGARTQINLLQMLLFSPDYRRCAAQFARYFQAKLCCRKI